MRRGVALDLWAKEDLHADAKPDAAPSNGATHAAPSGDSVITEPQRRMFFKRAREKGMTDGEIKTLIAAVAGVSRSDQIPKAKLDELLARIEAQPAPTGTVNESDFKPPEVRKEEPDIVDPEAAEIPFG